jgi:chromosome segregation ATPase
MSDKLKAAIGTDIAHLRKEADALRHELFRLSTQLEMLTNSRADRVDELERIDQRLEALRRSFEAVDGDPA